MHMYAQIIICIYTYIHAYMHTCADRGIMPVSSTSDAAYREIRNGQMFVSVWRERADYDDRFRKNSIVNTSIYTLIYTYICIHIYIYIYIYIYMYV